MRDIRQKFSVKYFLNLVLVDEEDRRYFKQQVIIIKCIVRLYNFFQEITLWRKADKPVRKPLSKQVLQSSMQQTISNEIENKTKHNEDDVNNGGEIDEKITLPSSSSTKENNLS